MTNKPSVFALNEESDPGSWNSLPNNTTWLVYWYKCGDWDGSGEAYCCAEGKYYTKSLGHCYGPWDKSDWTEIQLWELLVSLNGEEPMRIALKNAIAPLLISEVGSENGND